MKKVIEEIKKHGDRFEEVVKDQVPVRIWANNYKLLWDAICDDQDYLSSMIEVTTGKDGKASFVSNRIAGIILLNADSKSHAFKSVTDAMICSYDSFKELGLRKIDAYTSETLLTLLLKRGDINFELEPFGKFIDIATSLEGAADYGKETAKLNSEDAKIFKEAFLNVKSPITDYRDLRYYILRNPLFEEASLALIHEFYADSLTYAGFIDAISRHIAVRMESIMRRLGYSEFHTGAYQCTYMDVIDHSSVVECALKAHNDPQSNEIIGDIELLRKMLKVRALKCA